VWHHITLSGVSNTHVVSYHTHWSQQHLCDVISHSLKYCHDLGTHLSSVLLAQHISTEYFTFSSATWKYQRKPGLQFIIIIVLQPEVIQFSMGFTLD